MLKNILWHWCETAKSNPQKTDLKRWTTDPWHLEIPRQCLRVHPPGFRLQRRRKKTKWWKWWKWWKWCKILPTKNWGNVKWCKVHKICSPESSEGPWLSSEPTASRCAWQAKNRWICQKKKLGYFMMQASLQIFLVRHLWMPNKSWEVISSSSFSWALKSFSQF